VPKSALGRGLGALSDGAISQKRLVEDLRSTPNGQETARQSGLDLLLHGRAPDQSTLSGIPASPNHSARKIEISLLKLSLFSADFFLVAQAALFVFKNPKPLGFWETSFCVIAVGLGAWLSFLAVLLDSRPPK
jgi:hypothetical protein